MSRTIWAITGVLASMLVLPSGCGGRGENDVPVRTKRLHLGHVLPQNHPVHEAIAKFADLAKEKTGGRVEIVVHPGGQMGAEDEMVEKLQQGTLDFTKTTSSLVERFSSAMKVYSLPYLFRDRDHMWNVLDSEIGESILTADAEMSGLVGLCYFDAGFRSVYTIFGAVKSPADLQGKKIRVQTSESMIRTVELMGATARPIDWGELFSSLQNGTVDGAENNIPSLFSAQHYRVAPHYSLTEHVGIPDVLLVSRATWTDRLSEDERLAVREAAEESSANQRTEWERLDREYLEQMKQEGLKVHEIDKTAFIEATSPRYSDPDVAGTPLGEMAARIRAWE